MPRAAFLGLLVAFLGFSAGLGEEIQGTVKRVDRERSTITVRVGGEDRTLPVSKDASFVSVGTVADKKGKTNEKLTVIEGGLGAITPGTSVILLTEKTDGKDAVTSIKVGGGGNTDNKKAAPPEAPKKKKKKKDAK